MLEGGWLTLHVHRERVNLEGSTVQQQGPQGQGLVGQLLAEEVQGGARVDGHTVPSTQQVAAHLHASATQPFSAVLCWLD